MIWTQTTRGVKFQGRPDRSIFPRQFLNHFKHHPQISNKMNLFYNLHQICIEYNLNIFNFVPITFIFKSNSLNFLEQISHFFRFFKALKYFNFLKEKGMWGNNQERNVSVGKRYRNLLSAEDHRTFLQLSRNRNLSITSKRGFGTQNTEDEGSDISKISRPKTRVDNRENIHQHNNVIFFNLIRFKNI